MNSLPSPCADVKARLKTYATATLGFDACGVAVAAPVDAEAADRYRRWVEGGRHGDMAWAARHMDVRDDPRLLLEGARSVIVVALNYLPAERQPAGAPRVAMYAYGRDYHRVMRSRLQQLARHVTQATGAACRVTVDSAPMRERYWAVRAGLGFIGVNNTLILPGRGSFFVLGTVVTTLEMEPDEPCRDTCMHCLRCVAACPVGALAADGRAADARRCLSALTIENHDEALPPFAAGRLDGRVAGCDECQTCCPHNAGATPTAVADFAPRRAVMELTAAAIENMSQEEFDEAFAGSALRRVTLDTLRRNARCGRSHTGSTS